MTNLPPLSNILALTAKAKEAASLVDAAHRAAVFDIGIYRVSVIPDGKFIHIGYQTNSRDGFSIEAQCAGSVALAILTILEGGECANEPDPG